MRLLSKIIILFILLIPSLSFGATRYFDRNLSANCVGGAGTSYRVANRDCGGSDGTVAYKDFSGHVTAASFTAGDTYYVRDGTYDCSGNGDSINIQRSNVTLSGYLNETAIISGNGSGMGQVIYVAGVAASPTTGVLITKLSVTGSTRKGIVFLGDVRTSTISYCKSYSNYRAGITMIGSGTDYPSGNVIEYNECYENGKQYDGEAGISVQYLGAGNIIRFNKSYNNGQKAAISLTSWTNESGNIWYASYDDANGVYGKLFLKVSAVPGSVNGCYYSDQKTLKADLAEGAGGGGVCTGGQTGDYWIDAPNNRMYVYIHSDPTQGYYCPSPSGARYPDGNGITLDTNSGGTKVYGNIVYGNGGSGINSSNPHSNGNVYIYNNTAYDNGKEVCSWGTPGWGYVVHYGNRGNINIPDTMGTGTIYVKNNIMSKGGQFNLIWYTDGSYTGTYDINYNLYGESAGLSEIKYSGALLYTLAEFQAATIHEDNAQQGNPLFNNAVAGNFNLKSSSPAIDTGVDLGASYNTDIAGITRPTGSAWDIGAYEFGVSSVKGLTIQGGTLK